MVNNSFERIKYRPDIDGLRAFAVVGVVIFHAFPKFLVGGFIGVDIFFVISGYLISSIIIYEIQDKKFSFINFYNRRIKRILPSLIIVLISTLSLGYLFLLPTELKQLGKHLTGGALFVSNFLLWSESGYFDNASEAKPLLNLWSLAVEEQFYIVYPFLIFFALKANRVFCFCLLTLTISLVANVSISTTDQVADFYSPLSRYWEFMVGALAVWLINTRSFIDWEHAVKYNKIFKISNELTAAIGLALLILSMIFIKKDFGYPGLWAVIPVASTLMLIVSGPQSLINKFILSNKAVVCVGLISYPLYLWHWPLLTFLRINEGREPDSEIRLCIVIISILLSYVTYRYVENPIRHAKSNKTAYALICTTFFIGFIGYAVYLNDGFKSRHWVAQFKDPESFLIWPDKFVTDSACTLKYPFYGRYCLQSNYDKSPEIALIGDSHANHLYPGLSEFYKAKGYGVLNLGVTAPFWNYENGPIAHSAPKEKIHRLKSTESILDFVSNDEHIKLVILGFREAAVNHSYINYLALRNHLNLKSESEIFEIALNETLQRLTSTRKTIVVTVDIPNLTFSPAQCALNRRFRLSTTTKSSCSLSRADFDKHVNVFHLIIKRAKDLFPEVVFVPLYDFICDDSTCSAIKSDLLLYRDDNHLSVDGSLLVGKYVGQYIESNIKSPRNYLK